MNDSNVSEPQVIDINALQLQNPDNVRPVYSNNATLAIGPWDIRIIFSEVVASNLTGQVSNELRAHITMNPGHAKALISALTQTIEAYEQQFGKINLPSAKPQVLSPERKA
jgi:hypothetical protein